MTSRPAAPTSVEDRDRVIAMRDYLPAHAARALSDHAAVVVAHDAVHPDRDACGGVGGCLLMRTEHGAEEVVISWLRIIARHGGYTVEVCPGEHGTEPGDSDGR